jgi:hypothetical protein
LALGERDVDRVWDPVFEVVGLEICGGEHRVKVLLLKGHAYLYELYLIWGCVMGKIVNVYPLHPYLTFTIFRTECGGGERMETVGQLL